MTDTTGQRPVGAEKPDQRGTPPGTGTITPEHGGRIGNPPFEPTAEQRLKVKTLAQALVDHRHIATIIGCNPSTLYKYFRAELDEGTAATIAAVSANYVQAALNGDRKAQRVLLEKRGGWNTHVEVSGPNGGPLQHEHVDLSRLTAEQLEEYGRLAAIAEGEDPDLLVATPIE